MTEQEEKDVRRIAVVGAGISGLSAAWLLHRSGACVTLFEKEGACGGHSLTDESPGFAVDLGFQVFNLTTYPHLVGLFDTLGIDTEESEMSFALSMDQGALEWASHGLGTIFAQRQNLWKLSFWQMIWDVVRFGREAPKVLDPKNASIYCTMSLGTYLKKHGYSRAFQHNYLLPMCAAVWSAPNSQVFAFPVVMLVRFWQNHHLLDLIQRPVWRVVKDRSRSYVNAILADLEDTRVNAEVTGITPATPLSAVSVETSDGRKQEFNAVILATHSDTSLRLLGHNPPQEARDVLEAIPYAENDVWVHTDRSLMPRDRVAWASWNFIGRSDLGDDAAVCVSYWLNRLQDLPTNAPDIFVTLNPMTRPDPACVTRRLSMSHPAYSYAACQAQSRVPEIQGVGGIYYAGAWCGYGFHEDGLRAGIAAAELLGARLPWTPRAASPKIGLLDRLCIALFDPFARLAIQHGHLRLILPNGQELKYGSAKSCSPVQGEEWRGTPRLAAVVRVFDCAFFRKIILRHDSGLGESYMDNDFEVCGDLGCLLAVLTANAPNIQANRGALSVVNWVGAKLLLLSHLRRSNTISGSRRNIEEHYDAGNDMYRLFLDPSMTYSCGLHMPGDSLEVAQMRKLDSLIDLAKLTAGDNVLEIGCGWGSLAIRAVQTVGCKWTGVTLSKAQLKEAQGRVKAAGLDGRITLLFCDYRELAGTATFDKVISCEMIEAVGQEHLPTYFSTIGAMLRVGGTAVIQAISVPDERYEAYCASSDFIREHVFPGGHLPSLGAMLECARWTGLSMTGVTDIGPDYALTLRAWRAAWEQGKEAALTLGYSERFWRKYRFYFAYCEAAFDAKYIHNFQTTWLKAGEAAGACPSSSQEASAEAPLAARAAEPADPFTQVLLAVYFFLAGIAVSQSRLLWVMPLASAGYHMLLIITAAVVSNLPRLNTSVRELGAEGQVWLSVDIVHLIHSAAMFLAALTHVTRQPSAWLIQHTVQSDNALLPDLLVCTSAGFFGWCLFTLVHQRLFKRVYKVVLHFTILLVVFGSAAYKAEHTPLLACSLLSELSTVFYLLAKIQDLQGVPVSSPSRKLILMAEVPSTFLLRLLPHAFIGASVLLNAASFSNKGYHLVAVIGSLYINVVNIRRMVALTRAVINYKSHTA